MDLFLTLEKKQRKQNYQQCSEMKFFLENVSILNEAELFNIYKKASKPFDVVRANLIIRAIQNKDYIERSYLKIVKSDTLKGNEPDPNSPKIKDALELVFKSLPYYLLNKEKIYIPIFSKTVNEIYTSSLNKLLKKPYRSLMKNFDAACVDPFDYYGSSIFNSYFTRLILLKKKGVYSSYYDYDSSSIYFVNGQGRLDASLCLFDVYLQNPSTNHMLGRLAGVVDAYYENNKDKMSKNLVENKLISRRIYNLIKSGDNEIINDEKEI